MAYGEEKRVQFISVRTFRRDASQCAYSGEAVPCRRED